MHYNKTEHFAREQWAAGEENGSEAKLAEVRDFAKAI